jgi:surface antigen
MKISRNMSSVRRLMPGTLPGLAALLIVGCGGSEPLVDESTAGQVLGGVAGAAAGTQVGDGSGQTIATIAGALIGSVVGERIGARMEARDLERTAQALEYNERAATETWVNPNTGNEFAVTPVATYEEDGRPCREFEFSVATERGRDTEERTACRQADGTWRIVS